MRYRKHVAWSVVLCMALGLGLLLISLWVQSARQAALLDRRIEKARARYEELRQRHRRLTAQLERMYGDTDRVAIPGKGPGVALTPAEQAEFLRLLRLSLERRRQRSEELAGTQREEMEALDELGSLERERRAAEWNSWHACLWRELRRRTGR
jgi:hypothetical protein